ncbi:MAG: copper resistance CopC/CopD family protein [Ilumatobacter sp.]|uniref:copper resistance CopC/CopD family protein n=1 Tax=Ilumatobacter sp. TaxID=1967498 RepID=UPI0039197BF9
MSEHAPSFAQTRPDFLRRIAVVIGLLIAVAGTVINPATASAHTGFESSTPGEGAAISEPVDLVTIVFTGAATPVGEEFIALTPAGVLQAPINVESIDDKVFSMRFDPPLAGGQVGIRWNVQAADAHPIEGAFAFTVDAPVPTTAAPATTAPAATVAPAVEQTAAEATSAASAGTVTAAPVEEAAPSAEQADATATDADGVDAGAAAAPAAQSLDEFLAVDVSTPGETTATVGRVIGFLGVALGLGAFAFVATALRGRREEVRQALTAVRVLGAVIAVGAAIEYVGVTRIAAGSLASGWSTNPGLATVLRFVGGIGLAAGLAGAILRGQVQRLIRRPSVARSLSSAVLDDIITPAAPTLDDGPIVRWTPDARSWPALTGVVLIIVSFWFDGHTVSKGFRPLHDLANSIHVVAGAVWVGGVVMMAAIIWSRYRSGQPMRVVELVVRFSKIATIALASVVVAGGVMAFLVLDNLGELTGTPWGKILLLKTAAVGLAMLGGAYNHFRLLPALEADPESPELLAELRSTVTAEAIMLVFVVCVTAWLVAAAS